MTSFSYTSTPPDSKPTKDNTLDTAGPDSLRHTRTPHSDPWSPEDTVRYTGRPQRVRHRTVSLEGY